MNEITLNIPSIDSIKELIAPLLNEVKDIKGIINTLQLENQYYRNKDLKTKFGMSDKTIQNYREQNLIPFTKIGDLYFYPVSKFNEIFIANSNYELIHKKLK
jgi:hypothetical protein